MAFRVPAASAETKRWVFDPHRTKQYLCDHRDVLFDRVRYAPIRSLEGPNLVHYEFSVVLLAKDVVNHGLLAENSRPVPNGAVHVTIQCRAVVPLTDACIFPVGKKVQVVRPQQVVEHILVEEDKDGIRADGWVDKRGVSIF